MTSSPASSVKKEELFRANKLEWMHKERVKNAQGNIEFEHEKQDFLDETKADLAPRIRSAVPSGDHLAFYGKRSFVGFPGFGEGKIAQRRKLRTSSQLSSL